MCNMDIAKEPKMASIGDYKTQQEVLEVMQLCDYEDVSFTKLNEIKGHQAFIGKNVHRIEGRRPFQSQCRYNSQSDHITEQGYIASRMQTQKSICSAENEGTIWEKKTGFNMEEILRKYIRYVLNEKPFNPDLVANLIHLRKSSTLEDGQVAEVLNEVSRRIVKEKGPIVMDTEGFTERGIQRKVAVQALFSKLLYLAELDEFCSTTRSSLSIKEIFGVT
ncbi:hypothetical protein KI387_034221, partial [Taxus chinensis]